MKSTLVNGHHLINGGTFDIYVYGIFRKINDLPFTQSHDP